MRGLGAMVLVSMRYVKRHCSQSSRALPVASVHTHVSSVLQVYRPVKCQEAHMHPSCWLHVYEKRTLNCCVAVPHSLVHCKKERAQLAIGFLMQRR